MHSERGGYGFTVDDKRKIHEISNGHCQHIDCARPSNGIVHHLEGVFIARLDNKDKRAISDPNLNALKLCDLHAFDLDQQQQYQVDCLIYERRSKKKVA